MVKRKINFQLFAAKSKSKRYYSLYQDLENKTADIYIYGDITSWPWLESDVSSYTLSKELQELDKSIETINVYINSYGGEVAEGLAIYNALKRHKAKVITYVDGFACSIASVIFAAGDERVMTDTSLLMIHNAWTWASGNAEELRKQADDLEKITQASVNAYMSIVNITEEKLKEMMDNETWINGEEAVEMGFATKLIETGEKTVATQSIRKSLMQKIVKPPEKVVVLNTKVDEEKIEQIVKECIEKSIKTIDVSKMLIDKSKKRIEEIENKPLEMMKAFFNAKNKEEDE